MKNGARYVVTTHWGTFSLDEGSYQDYLAGKLWICWTPGKPEQPKQVASGYIHPNVTDRAIALRDQADKIGILAALYQLGVHDALVPYSTRLADLSIDEMNLTVRSSNGLKRANIHTFASLKEVLAVENGLLNIRNIGQKSIWSAYYKIVPKQKTALLMRYSPSGKLVRGKISALHLNIASLQGIEKIIFCDRKTEEVVQNGVFTCSFSNLDDFKNCLSGQAREYEKLRELDPFQLELLNVITHYFSDITNHNQLRSILKDCFPTRTRDINLLVLLIRMNILQKIKNQDKIDTLFVNNLVSLMENEHAVMADNARYAVNTWCLCYGKYTLGKECNLGNS